MPERERESASGPGGNEPAGQRTTSSPDSAPSPGKKHHVLGRLMATPTFLAGFCTVLASILAYGTTQTHLLYSTGMPPACAEASCSAPGPSPGNGGGLGESASPGIGGSHGNRSARPEQGAPPPATGGSTGRDAPPSRPRGSRTGHQDAPRHHAGHPAAGSPGGPQVAVVYRTQQRWSGRFLATVTITNNGKTVLSGWQLQMDYRQVRIGAVWGARWFPDHPRSGTGLVAALSGQRPLRPGMSAQFVFTARGDPGLPGGCAFNGHRCRFRHHPPRKPRAPRKPHHHAPGPEKAHHPGPSHPRNPDSVHLAGLVLPGPAVAGHARTRRHPGAGGHPLGHGHPFGRGHPHASGQPHGNGQGPRGHQGQKRSHRHHRRAWYRLV